MKDKDDFLNVWEILKIWTNDNAWGGYGTLEYETRIKISVLRRILKRMLKAGLVTYCWLCAGGEELGPGTMRGRGYFCWWGYMEKDMDELFEIYLQEE